jgi:peptide/nickel transport system ATP-binding protein/oligopeptide transport system ATP-binding protein
MAPLLTVSDLVTEFATARGPLRAVDGASIEVGKGETVGLVGESGCGKTALGLSLLRLIEPPGRVSGGSIRLEGDDLLAKSEAEMRRLRGHKLTMIFQDPTSTLNPVVSIGKQVAELARTHRAASRREARKLAIEMLAAVGIPAPAQRYNAFPHELSGGMQQRVIIACALLLRPQIVVADEPTTALDVTVQGQILDLLARLASGQSGTAVVLISHDLGVVAETCARVYVMYCGKVVESGPTERLLAEPQHPYTQGLLASIPKIDGNARALQAIPGTVADPFAPPAGCRFHPRCPHAMARCRTDEPRLRNQSGCAVACHLYA